MKIVISHQNTDFDGLASMLAVRKLWPEFEMVLSSALSLPVKKYLALHKDWLKVTKKADVDLSSVEEVILVDGRDQRRFREFRGALEAAKAVRVFDHHPAGPEDLEVDEEVVEPVGACATLLVERMEEQEITLSPREATLLLLGIYADTGSLSFSSTTVRDVRAAAYLLGQGAQLPLVNRYLQQEFSPNQQQLLVQLLQSTDVIERHGIAIGCGAVTSKNYVKGASMPVERVVQLLGLDAYFAVLEAEDAPSVQVIGRSLSKHLDASAVVQPLGGGGHPSAASASVKKRGLEDVRAELRHYLETVPITPVEVGDVMTSPVETITPETTLGELRQKLRRWCISGVPVVRDGDLVGVVSQRDGEQLIKRGEWHVPVAGFMSHQVISVEANVTLERALELMVEHDIGRLPVMEEGRLVGIVSRSDALRRLYGDDEVGSCG